jgi:hypothetical protein
MAVRSALRADRQTFTLRKIPGTHFSYRLNRPHGHSAAGRNSSTETSNDRNGNRTRDLPACSIVPRPTTLPCFMCAKLGLSLYGKNIPEVFQNKIFRKMFRRKIIKEQIPVEKLPRNNTYLFIILATCFVEFHANKIRLQVSVFHALLNHKIGDMDLNFKSVLIADLVLNFHWF